MKRVLVLLFIVGFPFAAAAQGGAAPTGQAAPPPLPDMSLKARFGAQYQYVRGNLLRMAELMPAEHYGFQPAPQMKTFAASMGHIIRSNAAQCSTLIGRRLPLAGEDLEQTLTTKAQVVAALTEAFTFCDEYFNALADDALRNGTYESAVMREGQRVPVQVPRVATVSSFLSHNNEMYGYMAVYLRLKDIVPPSSEPRR